LPREPSLDSWLSQAEKLKEKAETFDKITTMMKDGYVTTPLGLSTKGYGPSERERASQIDVLVHACMSFWNNNHKPIHISKLCAIAESNMRHEKKMGRWHDPIPSRRSLERSTNYAADENYAPNNKMPKLQAWKPGWYIPNLNLYDEDTRKKIQEMIKDFKNSK
jgi:hypothetical protein